MSRRTWKECLYVRSFGLGFFSLFHPLFFFPLYRYYLASLKGNFQTSTSSTFLALSGSFFAPPKSPTTPLSLLYQKNRGTEIKVSCVAATFTPLFPFLFLPFLLFQGLLSLGLSRPASSPCWKVLFCSPCVPSRLLLFRVPFTRQLNFLLEVSFFGHIVKIWVIYTSGPREHKKACPEKQKDLGKPLPDRRVKRRVGSSISIREGGSAARRRLRKMRSITTGLNFCNSVFCEMGSRPNIFWR